MARLGWRILANRHICVMTTHFFRSSSTEWGIEERYRRRVWTVRFASNVNLLFFKADHLCASLGGAVFRSPSLEGFEVRLTRETVLWDLCPVLLSETFNDALSICWQMGDGLVVRPCDYINSVLGF